MHSVVHPLEFQSDTGRAFGNEDIGGNFCPGFINWFSEFSLELKSDVCDFGENGIGEGTVIFPGLFWN